MSTLQRAAALAAAAAMIVALAACSIAGASPADTPAPTAAPTAGASEPPVGSAAAIAEYVQQFGPTGDMSSIDGAAVTNEFHAAAASFPLALPDRYTWPAETSRSFGTATQWPYGTGAAEAYLYWEGATATAAYVAQRRGDAADASAHLESLVEGYASPVRSMYIDPEQPGTDSDYYRSVIEPALQGDWEPLTHAQVASFVSKAEYQAIAAQAGDVLDVGTEGFSRSIDDQPGSPGYIDDTRIEMPAPPDDD